MILALGWRIALGAGLIAAAVPAHADVLEIGDEGAHWVVGAQAAPLSAPAGGLPDSGYADVQATDDRRLHRIPPVFLAKVQELAARYDLSPALIEALVWQESRWRHDALSHKGARGLTQLMPGTARDLGVDANDPFANLEGGARYLRAQLNRFGGDLEKALAAYNAGPARVEREGKVPRIAETRNYVAAILTRLAN